MTTRATAQHAQEAVLMKDGLRREWGSFCCPDSQGNIDKDTSYKRAGDATFMTPAKKVTSY